MTKNNKRYRNTRSTLINSVVEDNLALLKSSKNIIINSFGLHQFTRLESELMHKALINGSTKCVDYLINTDVEKPRDYKSLLLWCNLNKIEAVYNTIIEFYGVEVDKYYIANRLIQPHKLDDNKNRINFIYSLMSSGFLTSENVNKAINKNIVSSEKKRLVTSLLREIKLNGLGL